MKLRDMMFLVIGGLLVISGMVLNTLLSGDAEAQVGLKDVVFRNITCRTLTIQDGYKERGFFGLSGSNNTMLEIYGDDGKTEVAYLGVNPKANNEMNFYLQSKSTTDKRTASISIGENGGSFVSFNKMGENVAFLGVGDDGGGGVQVNDKFGYIKKVLR